MKNKEFYYRARTYYIKNEIALKTDRCDYEFFSSLEEIIKEEKELMDRVMDGKYYIFDGKKFISSLHRAGRFEICVTEFVKYTPKQLKSLKRLFYEATN